LLNNRQNLVVKPRASGLSLGQNHFTESQEKEGLFLFWHHHLNPFSSDDEQHGNEHIVQVRIYIAEPLVQSQKHFFFPFLPATT